MTNKELFIQAYIEAMLFIHHDDEELTLSEKCKEVSVRDCTSFFDNNSVLLSKANEMFNYGYDQAGHDFYFTRNGHGVGFWDRGIGQIGLVLTDNCKLYSSSFETVQDNELVI